MLPDRDRCLELVDECPGGGEGLGTVDRGGGDHDRGVADREPADPVHRGHADHVVGVRHVLGDLAQPGQRGRMRGVVESGDLVVVVVVADRSDEDVHATRSWVRQGGEDLRDVERLLAQPHQAYDGGVPDGVLVGVLGGGGVHARQPSRGHRSGGAPIGRRE